METETENETMTETEAEAEYNAREARLHAVGGGDFNALYQSHPSGPLITAESAYHAALKSGADHETLLRRWPEYARRQKANGLNVPHLANWLRRGGWADSSLDEETTGTFFPEDHEVVA